MKFLVGNYAILYIVQYASTLLNSKDESIKQGLW